MYVTDAARSRRSVVDVARAAAAAGVDAIQVREPELADRALVELVRGVVEHVRPLGARVLVNDRFDVAAAAGADGVHLRSRGLDPTGVRAAMDAVGLGLLGVAAHSAGEVVALARTSSVDYATVGPLHATGLKPALEWQGLQALLAEVRAGGALPPLLVLGGVGEADGEGVAALARPGEALGVAAIRLFQDAGDDDEVARRVGRLRMALGA